MKLVSDIKDSKLSFYSTELMQKSVKLKRKRVSKEINSNGWKLKDSDKVKLTEQSLNNIKSVPKLKRFTYSKITKDQCYFSRGSKSFRAKNNNSLDVSIEKQDSI